MFTEALGKVRGGGSSVWSVEFIFFRERLSVETSAVVLFG